MCNYSLIIFLLYLSNNLYESNARKIELQITDSNGKLYTNSTYYYTNEETVVMTCKLINNLKKFKLFWTQEHHDGRVVATKTNTTVVRSKITVDLDRGGHGDNLVVLCHANEEPAGDGTTNIAVYVQFIKTGTKTPEPNRNQTVASSTASERDMTLYWSVGAGTFVIVFVVALVTCVHKKNADKRLVEFEMETSVSEVVAAKVTQVQPLVASTYAAPRDYVHAKEEANIYIDPFRETDVNLMYSIPVIKSKRIAVKKEMDHDDHGSYDYVVQTHRAGYGNSAGDGNAPHVNDISC